MIMETVQTAVRPAVRTPHPHRIQHLHQLPLIPDADPTEAPSGEDDPASVAARYIGQSMSELENACGSPNGSDYEDEPESGKTGYYYYDTFTVSTTFDNDGNEVVSGVW